MKAMMYLGRLHLHGTTTRIVAKTDFVEAPAQSGHIIERTLPYMHDFQYEAPLQLAEAIDQLAKHNGRARLLAGGTDLIDQMQTGKFTPDG